MLCAVLVYLGAQTGKPGWVDRPAVVFPGSLFVSAVGGSQDRRGAENSALGGIVSYFRQSVINSITVKNSEGQKNGAFSSETEASQTIEAVSALESLIGAEIKDTWYDERRNVWYAVAVMEKAKCAPLYSGEIDRAASEIAGLLDIPGGLSLETIRKCRKAQKLIDKAGVLALVHSMLGGGSREAEIFALSAKAADTLNQAKAFPINIYVLSGDRHDRIRNAFAGIFTGEGFKTGGVNSRYTLEVAMILSEAPRNQYYNTRYTMNAVLKDIQSGVELFVYNTAGRESHSQSQEDAVNRAYIGAERKIKAEFPGLLREYLEFN